MASKRKKNDRDVFLRGEIQNSSFFSHKDVYIITYSYSSKTQLMLRVGVVLLFSYGVFTALTHFTRLRDLDLWEDEQGDTMHHVWCLHYFFSCFFPSGCLQSSIVVCKLFPTLVPFLSSLNLIRTGQRHSIMWWLVRCVVWCGNDG
jgi:hypothetical protein